MGVERPRRWGWIVAFGGVLLLWLAGARRSTVAPLELRPDSNARLTDSEGPRLEGQPGLRKPRPASVTEPALRHATSLVLQIMSLQSGAPLANMVLPCRAIERTLSTDSSGQLRVSPSERSALCGSAAGLPFSSVPDPAPAPPGVDQVLWVASSISLRLHCALTSDEPLTLGTAITVRLMAPFAPGVAGDPSPGEATRAHESLHLLSQLGLSRRKLTLRSDSAGVVTLQVPHLPSQGVSVSMPGFLCEYVEVPPVPQDWEAPPLVDIHVLLRPCPYVARGTLHGIDGRAIVNQRVCLLVLRRMDVRALNVHAEASRGAPVWIAIRNEGRDAFVKTMASAMTDSEGRFSIESKSGGDAVLVVNRDGFLISRTELPEFEGERSMDVTLQPAGDDPGAALMHGGQPVGEGSLHAADMSRDPQLWFVLPVRQDGRIPTAWFETGIIYELTYLPGGGHGDAMSLGGRVAWNGQPVLELVEESGATTVTGRQPSPGR